MNKNGCQVEERQGWTLVRVSGEVDLSWSAQLRKAILQALAQAPQVGVELSAVAYIDSSGIAALVEGFQAARAKQQRFVLLACSAAVRAVLQLARLDQVFPMADDLPQDGKP